VHRPHHVDTQVILEQAELRTEPGVEVQQLVAAVAEVEAVVEIHDAPVGDRLEQLLGLALELLVQDPLPERGWPGLGRIGA
jgi:hypothetical protein